MAGSVSLARLTSWVEASIYVLNVLSFLIASNRRLI